jgi:hypothetical protein
MADERISVSAVSLQSAEGYINAVIRRMQNAPGFGGFPRDMTLENDLKRALECLAEARMTDEEVRDKH